MIISVHVIVTLSPSASSKWGGNEGTREAFPPNLFPLTLLGGVFQNELSRSLVPTHLNLVLQHDAVDPQLSIVAWEANAAFGDC